MGGIDWDDAFDNMGHVPGSAALPSRWEQAAQAYRQQVRVDEDLAYGSGQRERFDLIWPDGAPVGLAVFIHGGFWMRLSKSYWTHYAEGARSRGWVVCIPSYTLAPDARLTQMTQQMGRAVAAAAAHVAGPIRLSGHSAGGHLATRLICEDTPLPPDVTGRVSHVLSISGLHDLRPLMWTAMNDTLRLDEAEARAESPALLRPCKGASVTTWVGGGERPEFLRQSRLLPLVWSGLGAATDLRIDGQHDHFSILKGLSDRNAAITRAFVG